MPSWILTLSDFEGRRLDTHHQPVSANSAGALYVEGNSAEPNTWHFLQYTDETQARSEWICLFNFQSGALKLATDLDDTFIRFPPLHPSLNSRVKLPYVDGHRQYFALLRDGDIIEFDNKRVCIAVRFDPTTSDPNVEVESSGPLSHKIKDEPKSDDIETDDESVAVPDQPHRDTEAEESQHLYSTSRENQSLTPRPQTRDSQVVKETPSRHRMKSQHNSYVPESLEGVENADHAEIETPAFVQPDPASTSEDLNEPPLDELPDVSAGGLPNTSPSDWPNFLVESSRSVNAGKSFTDDQFDTIIHNLNESNPPSQAPLVEPKSFEQRTSRKSKNTSVERHVEFSGENLVENFDSSTRLPEHSAPEVFTDVAQDDIQAHDGIEADNEGQAQDNGRTEDAGQTEKDDTIVVADKTPRPTIESHTESATASTRSKGKRVRDVGSATSASTSNKRAKLDEEVGEHEELTTSGTPASTASRRKSARRRSSESRGPPSTASKRTSSRTKSLNDEIPPSTISRRVSARHKSVESESASPRSPSLKDRRYSGPPPKILFSNTQIFEQKSVANFLNQQNASRTSVTTAKGFNFLCVGNGELLKTSKLLHSLTLKKTIVTEKWLLDSQKAKFLLDPADYLPKELKGIIDHDRSQIFSDSTIYVTPALRESYNKTWNDVMAIIRQAGGTNPLIGPLSAHDINSITLFMGAETDDEVAADLQASGHKVYRKDLLGASIIQGSLLLDDEAMVLPVSKVSPKPETQKPKATKRGGRTKKN